MQGVNSDHKGLDDAEKATQPYQISKNELVELVKTYKSRKYDEDLVAVENFGGIEGITQKLKTNPESGLTGGDFPERSNFFGSNYREPLAAKGFCTIFVELLDDFMIQVLIVAATISLIFGYIGADPADYNHVWIDGVAIYIAVLVVTLVSAVVDYKKEQEFVKRAANEDDLKICRVMRDGKIELVHHNYLQVGDVIELKYGMEVPVDGLIISCNQLNMDEAAMTGESDERRKETIGVCMARHAEKGAVDKLKIDAADNHSLPSPLILSGTSVSGGEGMMVCVMVGEASALGEILAKLVVRPEETPLQKKLDTIANDIGAIGTYFALLTIHVLLLRYFMDGLTKRNVDLFGGESGEDTNKWQLFFAQFNIWVQYLIIGVAIIVVAFPEGLPLAVMISLAYSIGRMLKDQNYVKRLSACEIMGGANNICSDKTGTLTLNQMKVAQVFFGKDIKLPMDQNVETKEMLPFKGSEYFTEKHITLLEQSIACNTPADLGATDRGMVDLLGRIGTDIDGLRKKHKVDTNVIRFPFSSKRKRMSTIIENATGSDGYDRRLLIKGASEIVQKSCSHYMDAEGNILEITDDINQMLDNTINSYAKKALRTIALAYKDIQAGECGETHGDPVHEDIKDIEKGGLTLIGILGIMDVVRTEVPEAVAICKGAGVTVRMVTGDNIVTAMAIAEICKIITPEEIGDPRVCLEGPEFYEKMGGLVCLTCKKASPQDCECEPKDRKEKVRNFAEFKSLMSRLKVLARSRPEDKYLLVTGLRNMGDVVAVTGDGTNDAPALKKADVGFGMGKTGTDTCKKAADILIQDDSFYSVVKAVSWGRNVYDNIQRFLQFQLTVNVNALITTFFSSCFMKASPLQPIQLLWVNLIMDSLAALALATELPKPHLLKRPPQNRNDHIVSRKMMKHIVGMALFQCVLLFLMIFAGEYLIYEPNVALRYNEQRVALGYSESEMVFPGRAFTLLGEPLYEELRPTLEFKEDSRHMTWIFNFFVWMQIWNMMCSRKIHDEWNIFSGIMDNFMFIVIWVFIVLGQVAITFSGKTFKLHPEGLSWEQHLQAMLLAATVFICRYVLVCCPDKIGWQLGKDSVYDRKMAAAAAK